MSGLVAAMDRRVMGAGAAVSFFFFLVFCHVSERMMGIHQEGSV